MKKLLMFFMLVSVEFMAGCKTDPAVIPPYLQNPALTGKWFLKQVDTDTHVNDNGDESDLPSVTYTSFTPNDYFEFKANNAAVYSSTLIGKTYTGYISAHTDTTPQSVTFKSEKFSVNFFIENVTKDVMILYQTRSVTEYGITTTVTNTYTYSH